MSQPVWCEHISLATDFGPYPRSFYYGETERPLMLHKSEMFCKLCGKPRPQEERDEDGELHAILISEIGSSTKSVRKALLAWKDREVWEEIVRLQTKPSNNLKE